LKTLHEDYGVPNVVISSIPLFPWLLELLPSKIQPSIEDDQYLLCIASSSDGNIYAQHVPLLPGYFSGVGDLFSAMLLGHYDENTNRLPEGFTPLSYAASQALTKTHAMLEFTNDYASSLPEGERTLTDDEADKSEPIRQTRRMRGRELRLVQGQEMIRSREVPARRLVPWTDFWTG
jgi:pyridoxine kinase